MSKLQRINKKTQRLLEIYVALISSDHHKSCDGYFSLNVEYDIFRDKIMYTWTHDGYINENKQRTCYYNLEQAEMDMQETVYEWINECYNVYKRTQTSPSDWDIQFPSNIEDLIKEAGELMYESD